MPDSPRDIIISYKQKIIDALVKSLENNNKVAGGLLAQSITADVKAFATHFSIEVSLLDYWKYVDEGRKKGSKQPPAEAMLKHIAMRGDWHSPKVKNIQNYYKDKKGIHKRKKPLPADKARKTLAYLIGRKIARQGIKPSYFVEEALGQDSTILNDLQRDVSLALGREILLDLKLK